MTTANQLYKDANDQQIESWQFYGYPFKTQGNQNTRYEPVGEVRYVVGWAADQMSRMGWDVLIDGAETWTVKLGGKTITSAGSAELDDDEAVSLSAASQDLLEQAIGWKPSVVREITTNYYVAGMLDYVALQDKDKICWRVLSIVSHDRAEILERKVHCVRGIWSHPADPEQPDAPLFGVLPVLREMDWLSKVSQSQSSNRVGMMGFIGIADGMSVANGGDFWKEIQTSTQARMKDPTKTGSVILRGAKELVAPDGNGMAGLSFAIPTYPYNDRIDHQMERLIQRLAYGLPIPPEILLGLQAQSRATAYQVEENSYRAHIEPPALLVAAVARAALQLLLPNNVVEIRPNPSDLLARRHSMEDAKFALINGAIGFKYFREVADFPEQAAATPADIALLKEIKNSAENNVNQPDPATVAAQEPQNGLSPILASVGGADGPPLSDEALGRLSDFLTDLDATLMAELSGATTLAADRAREKVGANARSREALKASLPREVSNGAVARHIGRDALESAGVPISMIVGESLSGLCDWWRDRAAQAQAAIRFVVGPSVKFTNQMLDDSVELLERVMHEHLVDTIDSEHAEPLPAVDAMRVLSVAGGTGA